MKINVIVLCIIATLISCNNTKTDNVLSPVEKIVYVKDTISERDNLNKIIELEQKLKSTRDSIKFENDSLREELFIANYKLARIKKYNTIAAKGNNIKFLRGWINRVLNNK